MTKGIYEIAPADGIKMKGHRKIKMKLDYFWVYFLMDGSLPFLSIKTRVRRRTNNTVGQGGLFPSLKI